MGTKNDRFRISTIAGTQYLDDSQKTVMVMVSDGVYRVILRSELKPGDVIAFRRSEIKLHSLEDEVLVSALRATASYTRAENAVFSDVPHGIKRFTDLLIRGVADLVRSVGVDSMGSRFSLNTFYKNGAQQILGALENGTLDSMVASIGSSDGFSVNANGFMANVIHRHLECNDRYRHEGPSTENTHYVTYPTVQYWVLNRRYAPADWNLFQFLVNVNPVFEKYYQSFLERQKAKTRAEKQDDIYSNVMFYRMIRSLLMSNLGIRNSSSGNDSENQEELTVMDEVGIVLGKLAVRIDDDLVGVKVTQVDACSDNTLANEIPTEGIIGGNLVNNEIPSVKGTPLYYSDYFILTFALFKAYKKYFAIQHPAEKTDDSFDSFLWNLSFEINGYLHDPSRYGAKFSARYHDPKANMGLSKAGYEAFVLKVIDAVESKEIDDVLGIERGTCWRALQTVDFLSSHEPAEYREYMEVQQRITRAEQQGSLRKKDSDKLYKSLDALVKRMRLDIGYDIKADLPVFLGKQSVSPPEGIDSSFDYYVSMGFDGAYYLRSKISACLSKYRLSSLIRTATPRLRQPQSNPQELSYPAHQGS